MLPIHEKDGDNPPVRWHEMVKKGWNPFPMLGYSEKFQTLYKK